MQSWRERSDNVIAQGTNTFSKHRSQYIHGPDIPTHVVDSDGLHMTLDNGAKYIDCGGLGTQLVGHRNNWSLPHVAEVELAERLVSRVRCIERVKFLKTGSAAVEAAVRFARAHTGRKHVVWSGYHGTDNTFISCERPGAGTVHEHSTKCKNIHDLEAWLKNRMKALPACVVWEPVILDDGVGVQQANREICRICRENGIVTIADEIVTGGRVPNFVVSNWWDLRPDLITLGKALGDGLPLSCVGGSSHILDNRDVFISNSHNGSLDGLFAGLDTMDVATDDNIMNLWDHGRLLIEQCNRLSDRGGVPVRLKGIPTRFTWTGPQRDVAKFWQMMSIRGFWCSVSMFPKMSWIPLIMEDFVNAWQECVDRFDDTALHAELPQPWFRRYQ